MGAQTKLDWSGYVEFMYDNTWLVAEHWDWQGITEFNLETEYRILTRLAVDGEDQTGDIYTEKWLRDEIINVVENRYIDNTHGYNKYYFQVIINRLDGKENQYIYVSKEGEDRATSFDKSNRYDTRGSY